MLSRHWPLRFVLHASACAGIIGCVLAARGQMPVFVPPSDPALTHANTIVALPDDFPLDFTNVTIDAEGVDPVAALQSVMQAGGYNIQPPRTPGNVNMPPINLHLKDQPFLEAVLQIGAQSPLNVNLNPRTGDPTVTYTINHAIPGIWCVTGPFAFSITTMEHIVNLGDNSPAAGNPGRAGIILPARGNFGPVIGVAGGPRDNSDFVTMQITALTEPAVRVLRHPQSVTLQEATDDHGNSLIPTGPTPGPSGFSTTAFPLRVTLAYPAENPGRLIHHFHATASYIVQNKFQTVSFQNPQTSLPATKTINGMSVSFGSLVWNKSPSNGAAANLSITINFSKGDFDGDWAGISDSLAGVLPRAIIVGGGANNPQFNPINYGNQNPRPGAAPDTVTATITIPVVPHVENGVLIQATEAPTITGITFDIPTSVTRVDVPMEFKDIPLP